MEENNTATSQSECANTTKQGANDLSTDMSSLSVRETKRTEFLPWDDYFMAVAFLSAMRSKDPSSQVGACIVNADKKIVGIGYNGMPIGCSDDELPWNKESSDPLQTKYMYVCHAEMNAIMNKNCSDVAGCRVYVALFPCNECAKLVIQAGIREVVFFSDKHQQKPETVASKKMLDMAGVVYRQYSPSQRKIELNLSLKQPEKSEPAADITQFSERDQNNKRKDYLSWEEYFMAMAHLAALRSKDPSTQVGACIVNSKKKIVGIGYNGMPLGCNDDLMPWGKSSNNKLETKYMYVCHAGVNAIMNKNSFDVSGCTLYVALFPCNECAKVIIQAGIKTIIYASDTNKDRVSILASKKMLDLAGIEYRADNLSQRKVVIDFKTIDWNSRFNSE
ncbi:deoxycytidylate deaminase-like isoform X1 [Portunus trituberculatus]|uniref:deoxycytidylate deaminase-like isoform X1 n=1 Tax=Portunus trituberculatus TaxID=210409 RepID=UPI001E1D0C70|nr:deoxycytidylate deaminase-like isoform X1 [Portunus trituberculatus]XP_045138165.1 deoxycytidylate deaminase-like isoform X1 [Portunus trituberculatus]XP_045138167.1 deoxycytidylate deaminase-like isoform X1 [Portunus trituberculatus]XP_045138168.1 deoxycytidylate deaminase-like isoform X1 [Portunus trituberculatus]XP_045138169.1 deoxycytidylate deaminase-like isoform X1 [Portunus trituberculatus]XP_045138170.1 deoxycytidylate deaminase-like isoform X1 [Portunus trituberculatus]